MSLPAKKSAIQDDLRKQTVLMYGPSKTGKTAFWAHEKANACYLKTDPGHNHVSIFGIPEDKPTFETWEELDQASTELLTTDHDFYFVVLDTLDQAYHLCSRHVCKGQGIQHEGDLAQGKGWALVRNVFREYVLRMSRTDRFGFVMLCQADEHTVSTRTGDKQKNGPALPGKSRLLAVSLVDLLLFVDWNRGEGEGKDRHPIIRTKPDVLWEAGERAPAGKTRLPDTLPMDFVALAKAWKGDSK